MGIIDIIILFISNTIGIIIGLCIYDYIKRRLKNDA